MRPECASSQHQACAAGAAGGANYSYEQINAELAEFVSTEYGIAAEGVAVAVVGLRLRSEHEDECHAKLRAVCTQYAAVITCRSMLV